ncbi:GNAT family N-acetyltransferase [Cribrihabitans neustonicus]|uniref:GNAT family N-acetyltransferase n=1 Tax=Cribrihabitans neustonicus TaxID=1429085 RepID=UPI003B5BE3A5
MQVRVAGEAEAEEIEALLGRCYPVLMAPAHAPQVLARALPMMTRANRGLLASDTYYAAVENGRITGCGGWTLTQPGSGVQEPGLAHIRHFATDPGCCGRGIGRALFERCRAEAAKTGAVRLQVLSSLNAEPFYARMGMARIETVSLPLGGGGFPAVPMEMPLGR